MEYHTSRKLFWPKRHVTQSEVILARSVWKMRRHMVMTDADSQQAILRLKDDNSRPNTALNLG